MKKSLRLKLTLQAVFAAAFCGSIFQVGCLGQAVRTFNPCGTVIACDPLEWDLLFADAPDYDLDATCSIPFACGVGGTGGNANNNNTGANNRGGGTTNNRGGQNGGGLFGGGGFGF